MISPYSPAGELLEKARRFTGPHTAPGEVTDYLLDENRKLPEADRVAGDAVFDISNTVITERDQRMEQRPGNGTHDYFVPLGQGASIDESEYLIDEVLPMEASGGLYGDDQTGKSFVLNDMAIHVALGRPWRGREVKQGPVLLIVGEGHRGIERRVAAWARYHLGEDKLPDGTPLYRSVNPAGLDCQEAAEFLQSRAEEIAQKEGVPPVMAVIDTVSSNMGAAKESSPDEMNTYLNLANQALRVPYGLCLIHIHHTGWRGDRPRGGSTFQRNADFQFRLTKATPSAKLTETTVEMLCEKQKDEDSRWTMWFRFHIQELNATKRNGEPMTSLVVVPDEEPANTGPSLGKA